MNKNILGFQNQKQSLSWTQPLFSGPFLLRQSAALRDPEEGDRCGGHGGLCGSGRAALGHWMHRWECPCWSQPPIAPRQQEEYLSGPGVLCGQDWGVERECGPVGPRRTLWVGTEREKTQRCHSGHVVPSCRQRSGEKLWSRLCRATVAFSLKPEAGEKLLNVGAGARLSGTLGVSGGRGPHGGPNLKFL